jgi:GNAT superfamily N-acetyltransferase
MDPRKETEGTTCAIPTRSLGHCKHAPRYAYVLEDRRGARIVGTYCAQHARGAGVARMLLPRAWEYTYVLDLASGVTIRDMARGNTVPR